MTVAAIEHDLCQRNARCRSATSDAASVVVPRPLRIWAEWTFYAPTAPALCQSVPLRSVPPLRPTVIFLAKVLRLAAISGWLQISTQEPLDDAILADATATLYPVEAKEICEKPYDFVSCRHSVEVRLPDGTGATISMAHQGSSCCLHPARIGRCYFGAGSGSMRKCR
jgi:hypothetical protein